MNQVFSCVAWASDAPRRGLPVVSKLYIQATDRESGSFISGNSSASGCKLNDPLTGNSRGDLPVTLALLWFNELPVVLEN